MTPARSPQLLAAYAYCRAIAKAQAKNFYYAFRALPQHKSDAMCVIYAFMRKADDLADDESVSIAERREAMARWTEALQASREVPASDPVFLALLEVQQQFGIPDALLDELVQGTTLDLQQQQPGTENVGVTDADVAGSSGTQSISIYKSYEDLYRYCYLVASVVGLVCIRIFGYSDPRAELFAEHTGVAFQLTNILRDVCEDASRGRLYLPADDMRRLATSPGDVLNACAGKNCSPALLQLLKFETARAEDLYQAAEHLIPLLDRDSQPAMRVLVDIYHGLLRRIAADPTAVFRKRVSVPTLVKLAILGRGMLVSAFAREK